MEELSRERLAEGRLILAELDAEHDALLTAAVAEGDSGTYDGPAHIAYDAWDIGDRLTGLSAEQLRCLLFAVTARLAQGDHEYSMTAHCFAALAELQLDITAGDARLLAEVAEPGPGSHGYLPFQLVLAVVTDLLDKKALGAVPLANAVADQVLGWNAMNYYEFGSSSQLEVADLRDMALELAERPPAPPPAEGGIGRDDGFGLAVIEQLGLAEDWPAGLAPMLEHCATARTARPGQRWEKRCHQLLAAMPDADCILRRLLEGVTTASPVRYLTDFGQRSVLIGYNEQLVRGLVWAAGLLDPDWLPELLQEVAVRCLRLCSGHVFHWTPVPGEKVPNACFWSLARSGSDASVVALARIGRATANRTVLRQLRKMLSEVSERRGMSADSMLERLTPDHGLDSDGQLTIVSGGERWVIQLEDEQGAVLAGPDDVPVPREAADALTEIRTTVSLLRARIEELFAAGREWHADDFAEIYVHHPVSGWLARRLVWTFVSPDGAAVSGFPALDGAVVTTHGRSAVSANSTVRLLHPVHATPDELVALRKLAADLDITQPLRQLWRETYRPTPDERATGLYSARYAGHVLRFGECYGLARRRGWAGGFLSGAWDGGDTAAARKDYPSAGLRASWAIQKLDDLSTEVAVDLCITDKVFFSPMGDVVRVPVPLAEVPADVFSEAMRDLDLVVSATSVANDPIWLERYRMHPELEEYWERASAQGLDELRVHRHAALEPYYRDPELAAKFELTERELVVRGGLATYRIDLATANVRTDPAGTWLSFDTRLPVPDVQWQSLPVVPGIDDDEILQRILVRAAMLADDERLASWKLLRQIRG